MSLLIEGTSLKQFTKQEAAADACEKQAAWGLKQHPLKWMERVLLSSAEVLCICTNAIPSTIWPMGMKGTS